ncbi:tetratricopeptide repeat protein [Actinopolyspora mortivallis]|uniref:Tetratricopeptide repeat protein n=1 Tax=Actinopolyspora mortivallis TaxID=33906 RepID=A0A2T0GZJ9_ACTMO|nr:hypothetical protein [Actinopolyspora mortivallis]PRW64546.1 hypothetical protein CEP50_04100 [Actinopolyspora mortivallis]
MARERGSWASRPGQELLESAWQWRWRVPELALLLGNRAASWARENGDPEQRLHAEYVALFAANRLGHAAAETERALGVFREAERAGSGELLDRLRIELACCARGSGSYDVASRVLDPLLEKEDVPARLRAHALVEFCGSLPMHRRSAERLRALDEADRLYAAESEHHRDLVGLLRARVDMARAGHHRGHGEFTVAIDAALRGMEYLRRLGDPAIDSGGVRAGLVLEQTQGLLELGRTAEAVRCSEELLHQPPRAAAAAPVGWLRLALATRVHLPSGRRRTAVESLHEALDGARKHELFDVQTAALNVLANLHEAASELPEALRCLREAYSVDHRHRRTLEHARLRLLEEFPARRFQGAAVPRQQSVGDVRSTGNGDTGGAALHRTPEVPSPSTAKNEDTGEAARRLLDALVRRSEETESGESLTGPSGPDTSRGQERGESPTRVAAEDAVGTPTRGERRTRAATGAKGGGGRRRREAEPSVPPQSGTSTPSATAAEETKHGSEEAASTPTVSYLTGGQDTPVSLGEQATRKDQPADFPMTEPEPTPRSHGVSASGVDYGWHFAAPREDPSGETSLISTFPGSESASADTTTVLPILPSEPETADTSSEVSSPPSEDLRGPTGRTPGEPPLSRQETPASGQHHTSRNSTAASEEEHRVDQHEESSSGRRSHGRSLAEIKAAIEAEQQGGRSARDSGPETFRSGGRRRRAASEDDPAEQSTGSTAVPSPDKTDHESPRGTVSEELLEQSRELIRDLPGVEAASERVDGTDQSGLADLLAEALVAYQHGRQETTGHDAAGAASHTSTVGDAEPVSGERSPFDRSATGTHDASPSDVPGREGRAHRRHAVGEEGSDGSRTWTPQVR